LLRPAGRTRLEVPMAGFLARLKARLLINSSRVWLERYNREFSLTMRPGERVLDAGAGEAPYRPFFAHLDYESADFEMVDKPYARSTYVCDLCERIPVENGRFNYVVFNQTLEHLKEPARALAELHRVLAPGGRILCTVPFFFEEHEQPFDFFRYTQFAHRYLFTQAGFEVERIEWLEGFFGTCAYMFQVVYRYLPWTVRGSPGLVLAATPFLAAAKIASILAAAVFQRLDLRCKVTDGGFPKNYVVIARRSN
jgi:SAM-dependent methyltransferase